jgi:transcriptional regulator with XRE-family HTH domain
MDPYAARVRAAGAYSNLSLDAYAQAIGVSKETLVRLQNDNHKRCPSLQEAQRIASATGVPLSFLTDGFDSHGEQLARIEAAMSELADQVATLVGRGDQQAREFVGVLNQLADRIARRPPEGRLEAGSSSAGHRPLRE